MEEKKAEPDFLEGIIKSPLGTALSQGFIQLYRTKPQFPVRYLGKWLKQYSNAQKVKQNLIQSSSDKEKQYQRMQQGRAREKQERQQQCQRERKMVGKVQEEFNEEVEKVQYVEDLLSEWLPEYLEKYNQLSGSYVGKMRHPRKKLEENNFDPAGEYDTDAPKIIEYIGASKKQQELMIGKILPSQSGRSFDVFNIPQDEPPAEGQGEGQGQGEQGSKKQQKPPKKKYIYVPDVIKQQKMFFFKYPQLGSYACYPLKYKSFLLEGSFDKGVVDYKEYVRAKEQTESQYKQKLQELKAEIEDARKKWEEFEVNDEEGSAAQKKNLEETFKKADVTLKEQENNPPNPPELIFDTIEQSYIVGCDTMGKDQRLDENILDGMDAKVSFLKNEWEKKQRKMLLNDILAFISDEGHLDSLANQYNQAEKNIIGNLEPSIKEQFTVSEKEADFELTVGKCEKLISLLSDQTYEKSQKLFFNYAVPKFKEIIQIGLMLVGYNKQEINKIESNVLDWRKVRSEAFVQKFLENLQKYQLRRDKSEAAKTEEYKINKILERLEKIQAESVAKYNIWIWMLLNVLKNMCWGRIQCRDAKVDLHQRKVKAKEDREAEMVKFDEETEKALETHKSQLEEELKEAFNEQKEQQWRKDYLSENPKPLAFGGGRIPATLRYLVMLNSNKSINHFHSSTIFWLNSSSFVLRNRCFS